MSRFFVGQRVRIRVSTNWPELTGTEGRVCVSPSEADFCGPCIITIPAGHIPVAPNAWGTCIAPAKGAFGASWFAPESHQLEPILDDHQSCEEDFKRDLDRLLEREGATC